MIVLAMFTVNFFHPGFLIGHIMENLGGKATGQNTPLSKDAEAGYILKNSSAEATAREVP